MEHLDIVGYIRRAAGGAGKIQVTPREAGKPCSQLVSHCPELSSSIHKRHMDSNVQDNLRAVIGSKQHDRAVFELPVNMLTSGEGYQ